MITAYILFCGLFFNLTVDRRHLSTPLHSAPPSPCTKGLVIPLYGWPSFHQAPSEVNIWFSHLFFAMKQYCNENLYNFTCLYNYFLSINFRCWNFWVKEFSCFKLAHWQVTLQKRCPHLFYQHCMTVLISPSPLPTLVLFFFIKPSGKKVLLAFSELLPCARCHLKRFMCIRITLWR